MTRRAVILGGTGQLGAASARTLLEHGWQVDLAHRGERGVPAELAEARSVSLDRSDADAVEGLCRGADLVLDCLAFAPADAAVHGRLVGEVGSVVVISTASVYRGENGTWLDIADSDETFPVLPVPVDEAHPTVDADDDPGYSPQKAALERALLAVEGLPVTILRPGAIHGPHSPALREWFFVKRALDGRERVPLAHLGQSRFGTSASVNVAELVRLAGEHPGRRVLNAVDDPAPTALEIGQAVFAHLGHAGEFVLLEGPPVDGVGGHPWAVSRPVVLSMAAARRELGYEPVGTHRATIGAAIDWMLEAVGDADWRERFPALSNRYGAASWFDYDAEDQALAR